MNKEISCVIRFFLTWTNSSWSALTRSISFLKQLNFYFCYSVGKLLQTLTTPMVTSSLLSRVVFLDRFSLNSFFLFMGTKSSLQDSASESYPSLLDGKSYMRLILSQKKVIALGSISFYYISYIFVVCICYILYIIYNVSLIAHLSFKLITK